MESKCIFCGSGQDITKEHPIPKQLFPKNKRINLIPGVPSCNTCNNGFSHDEELFREFLLNCSGYSSEVTRSLIDNESTRAMKKAPGKAFNLLSKMKPVFIKDNNRAKEMAELNVSVEDWQRYFRVINKIIRSLYYSHFASSLPFDVTMNTTLMNPSGTTLSPEEFFKCSFTWNKDYADICSYGYAMVPNSFSGVWILNFYNQVTFWNTIQAEA